MVDSPTCGKRLATNIKAARKEAMIVWRRRAVFGIWETVPTAAQRANTGKIEQLPPQTPPREDGNAGPEDNAKEIGTYKPLDN
jgi:hypothetical protein